MVFMKIVQNLLLAFHDFTKSEQIVASDALNRQKKGQKNDLEMRHHREKESAYRVSMLGDGSSIADRYICKVSDVYSRQLSVGWLGLFGQKRGLNKL